MNRYFLAIAFMAVFLTGTSYGQLPAYFADYPLYAEAEDLFGRQHYGAAQNKLQQFQQSEATSRGILANDLRTRTEYMEAMCAYHLERENTQALLQAFVNKYPEHSQAHLAWFYLGKSWFRQGQYALALRPFTAAFQTNALDQDKFDELVFMLAYSHYRAGNRSEAARLFDLGAKQENPWQADEKYYAGIIQYEDGNYEEAIERFDALKGNPKYGREAMLYKGNSLLELGRYGELYSMTDDLEGSSRADKVDPQIYFLIANASFEQKDFEKAADYYMRYSLSDKSMPRTDLFRHGFAHYKLKQYREAIPVLEKVVSEDDSLTQVSSYYLGFCFLEVNDPASARFAFRKAYTAPEPRDPQVMEDALLQYAKLSYAVGDYDDALRALLRLNTEYPNAPYSEDVRTAIGEIYLYSRNYPSALEYFESIPRTTPRAKRAYQTVCFYYGLQLYEQGQYPQARTMFAKASTANFDANMTLDARYWLAEAHFREGNFAEAEQAYIAYQRAPGANRHSSYAKSTYGKAWCDFKQQDYASAQRGFEAYLAQAGASGEKDLVVDATLRAGDCLFMQQQYQKAITYYQQVVDFRYTFRDYALFQIGESNYRLQRYQVALNTLEQIIQNMLNSELRDDALDQASEISATWLKDFNRASLYAEQLVREYPQSPFAAAAYNRLAIVAYNQGDENAAVAYFKKVLTNYDDKKQAKIALENLSQILPPAEFDQVFAAYRQKNPQLDDRLAKISFNSGVDRFYAGNYPSAIDQFTTYIKDFRNGEDYYEALLFRARSYSNLERKKEALADYKTIYSTPSVNDFTDEALDEAAQIYYNQRDFLTSLSLYQRLENLARNTEQKVKGQYGAAQSYQAQGNYEQAITKLQAITLNAEADVQSRTRAKLDIGHCQYLQGQLTQALQTFREVEENFKNAFGAEAQYMIVQILYDQGVYEETKEAGIYMKNTYPTFNTWKAKAFLIVAEANYKLGEIFQAKGVLESLVKESRLPEVVTLAQARLDEIEEEERQNAPSGEPGTVPADSLQNQN